MRLVLLFPVVLALLASGAASAQEAVVLERKPKTDAQAKAAQAQSSRLSILTQELEGVKAQLAAETAKKLPDVDAIDRLQRDITLLRKEIDGANKSPVPVITNVAGGRPAQPRIATAKAGATNPDDQGDEAEATPQVAYESWDIFHNFGKRKEVKKW